MAHNRSLGSVRLSSHEARGIILGTSLLVSMASFPCWAQGVAAPPDMQASLPGPTKPACGSSNHPGFSHVQMEAICEAEIAFLKKRKQELVLDPKSTRTAINDLTELLHYDQCSLGSERIMLGKDPGPDAGPCIPVYHGSRFGQG